MKRNNKSLIWMLPALFALLSGISVQAQDDLYYDPSTDTQTTVTYDEDYNEPSNVTRRYDGDDDQYYYDEDDYAYEYSSRIRRFHRPARAIDYYDPFFVDLWYYDPFYLPGASIYTYGYNDYWTWRRWRRWQRWNAWNSYGYYGSGWNVGWSPWGWNMSYGWGGWSAWNNPCVWNNYYYDPYWTWNGYNPYYGNVWVNNDYYYNNGGGHYNGYTQQTYTGPRRHGTTVSNSGFARLSDGTKPGGRLVVGDKETKVIDMRSTKPASTRVVRDNGARVPGDAERVNVPNRKPAADTRPTRDPVDARDPVRVTPQNDRERPNTDVEPSRRPSTQPETQPSRRPSTQDRPTRTQPQRTEPKPTQ
ncbi:MAG: hypothetical protein R2791_13945 [Saprospiraceae bacterium]